MNVHEDRIQELLKLKAQLETRLIKDGLIIESEAVEKLKLLLIDVECELYLVTATRPIECLVALQDIDGYTEIMKITVAVSLQFNINTIYEAAVVAVNDPDQHLILRQWKY